MFHPTSRESLKNLLQDLDRRYGTMPPQAEPAGLPDARRFRIMIIDDEPILIRMVTKYLGQEGYLNVCGLSDSSQALELLRQDAPDLILLDLMMPQVSGFDILQAMQTDPQLRLIPVVVLTAESDRETKLRALELGVIDFLRKPLDSTELTVRVRNVLAVKGYQDHLRDYSRRLELEVQARTRELEASRQDVIQCLARAAEFRDDDTGYHILRVGRYARIIGQALGLDTAFLTSLEAAAQLHDVGKIGIPDQILLKPEKLTTEEFEQMQKHCGFGKKVIERLPARELFHLQQHTEIGAKILNIETSPLLRTAMKVALTHHERWDGNGYPLGLAGEDIPLEGRITAVADVFDALSSRRPYKRAFPLDQCFLIMEDARGSHFDPRVLDAFFASRDEIIEVQIALANVE